MPRSLKDPKKAKQKNKGGAKKGEGSSSSLNGMSSIPAKVWQRGVDGLEDEWKASVAVWKQKCPGVGTWDFLNVGVTFEDEFFHASRAYGSWWLIAQKSGEGPDDPIRVTRILLNNDATMRPSMRVPSKYQGLTSLIKERITLALRYFIELGESNNKISPTDEARCNARVIAKRFNDIVRNVCCVAPDVVIEAFVAAATPWHWDMIERKGR
nr:glutamate-rich WD repeat-containing protein 1 [Tanacetum cinerariifolium]